jgi:hypothetical protein
MDEREEVLLTDSQLIRRWGCTKMHLWRLRKRGILCPPIKLGDRGRNYTRASDIIELERMGEEAPNAA